MKTTTTDRKGDSIRAKDLSQLKGRVCLDGEREETKRFGAGEISGEKVPRGVVEGGENLGRTLTTDQKKIQHGSDQKKTGENSRSPDSREEEIKVPRKRL